MAEVNFNTETFGKNFKLANAGRTGDGIAQIASDRFGKKENNAIADRLWASGIVGQGGFSADRLKLQKEMAERTGNTQLFAITSALLGKLNNATPTTNPITPEGVGNKFDTANLFGV